MKRLALLVPVTVSAVALGACTIQVNTGSGPEQTASQSPQDQPAGDQPTTEPTQDVSNVEVGRRSDEPQATPGRTSVSDEPIDEPDDQVPAGKGEWKELNLVIDGASNPGVDQLEQLDPDLARFVEDTVGAPDPSDGCFSNITVRGYHTTGYMVGEVSQPECGGGHAAAWSKQGGTWTELKGWQEVPLCQELIELGLPQGAPGVVCEEQGEELSY